MGATPVLSLADGIDVSVLVPQSLSFPPERWPSKESSLPRLVVHKKSHPVRYRVLRIYLFIIYLLLVFETGSHYVAGLELTM